MQICRTLIGPDRYVRSGPDSLSLPEAANDDGAGEGHEALPRTLLLICTGSGQDGLVLDLVLRHGAWEKVLLNGISEREAIAEARRLSGLHGARLAMLSMTGHIVELEPAPIPAPRRLGSPLSGRRPRFLARRKVGMPPVARPTPDDGRLTAGT